MYADLAKRDASQSQVEQVSSLQMTLSDDEFANDVQWNKPDW